MVAATGVRNTDGHRRQGRRGRNHSWSLIVFCQESIVTGRPAHARAAAIVGTTAGIVRLDRREKEKNGVDAPTVTSPCVQLGPISRLLRNGSKGVPHPGPP